MIKLKAPDFQKEQNLKSLLEARYSCRDFQNKRLELEDLASILWATCGKKFDAVTGATRTIPSAGATNPLELYLVVGENSVNNLSAGVYHYIIEGHQLELITQTDKRAELSKACSGQSFITYAPVSLVITADFSRTTSRYGIRGQRYVHIEVGHACQNTYLACAALKLCTVEVGAFSDDQVNKVLSLSKDFQPLSVMPIGHAKVNYRTDF